jgi:hypothetical protein
VGRNRLPTVSPSIRPTSQLAVNRRSTVRPPARPLLCLLKEEEKGLLHEPPAFLLLSTRGLPPIYSIFFKDPLPLFLCYPQPPPFLLEPFTSCPWSLKFFANRSLAP